jgi:ABC-2 type transport system ATP-binding protein
MITIKNVSKSFGSVVAVSDLSFQVDTGEIVGLLGPNGAGKSTTMRMMTGYLSPDTGDVLLDGISVVEDPTAVQQQIGYLPENNPLYHDMIVSDFLSYSAELKHIPLEERSNAIDFAVRSVSIESVYYRPIRELSKGYKQRVGLSIALLHKPKILILDEPSEGLDPNQRTEIRSLIISLAKNHTIVMSTHVMQEVEAVCNRMVIISNGKLVADGSPKELTRKTGSGGNRLDIEIEGKDVEKKLRKIIGVTGLEVHKGKEGRSIVKVGVLGRNKIQPALAKLAAREKWIIWKLSEEETHLEDVFHQLTGVTGADRTNV